MARIAYLLEDASLSGGVRVVLGHADVLTEAGHEVTLVSKSGPPDWRGFSGTWRTVPSFASIHEDEVDLVIATFWTTARAAYDISKRRSVHFCQGFEGNFTAYQPMRDEIVAAYRLPIPKIVVSRHLVDVCHEYANDVSYIGQIVDDAFFSHDAPPDNERPRVLLAGAYEVDFKGIDVGYEAVKIARHDGADFDLVRVSPWKPAAGEPVSMASEFHVGLTTDQMAALFRSCDIFLGPSRSDEGFGLPAAEAMASGLPSVLADIPSFRCFDQRHDFALFSPEDEADPMGRNLATLLNYPAMQETLRKRGREVVEQFRRDRFRERFLRVIGELLARS